MLVVKVGGSEGISLDAVRSQVEEIAVLIAIEEGFSPAGDHEAASPEVPYLFDEFFDDSPWQ